jgi:thermitase
VRILISVSILIQVAGAAFAQAQPHSKEPGHLIVHHRKGMNPTAAEQTLAVFGARVLDRLPELEISLIQVPEGREDAMAEALRRSGQFEDVEPDYLAEPGGTPNDPNYSSEWHLARIQAPGAWSLSTGLTSTIIAVVDSGVDSTHPDLQGKIVPGWSFISKNSDTHDVLGHGTAVAGTAAAATNNSLGVAGVAWNCKIMPLVVLNSSNYATYYDIASAITYAANHKVRIINVSIAGTSASSTLQNAVNYAWNLGSVVFAAAANNSSSSPRYPAACVHAIGVTATNKDDTFCSFSNYGSWIFLSAPGNSILTTSRGGGYQYWWGTSLATPVAAGVAALVLSRNPRLTATGLRTLLQHTSNDLGTGGFDTRFGWGRVNAYRAVSAALLYQ